MVADMESGYLMDWNKGILILAQCVVVCVLGTLVAVGRDSAITDGLMAVSGSLVGTSLVSSIAKKKTL
jgi:hypothetical protein